MAEKLNKLMKTGTNYLERFVNFLGSIFKNPEESSVEEEAPRPKKVFQLILFTQIIKRVFAIEISSTSSSQSTKKKSLNPVYMTN